MLRRNRGPSSVPEAPPGQKLPAGTRARGQGCPPQPRGPLGTAVSPKANRGLGSPPERDRAGQGDNFRSHGGADFRKERVREQPCPSSLWLGKVGGLTACISSSQGRGDGDMLTPANSPCQVHRTWSPPIYATDLTSFQASLPKALIYSWYLYHHDNSLCLVLCSQDFVEEDICIS